MADKVTNIKGDDPDDWMDEAQSKIGLGNALGVTKFDLSSTKWATDKTGKVTKGELGVTTQITRAHWSGLSGNSETALRAIDQWIIQHEGKHVALANKIVTEENRTFKKDVVGKTDAEAQALVDEVKAKIEKAYKALDASEGKLTISKGSKGVWTLKDGPA